LQDGVEVVTSPVTITDPGTPLGTHIFVLADRTGGQERWHAVSLSKPDEANATGAAAQPPRTVCKSRVKPPALCNRCFIPARP
jgi:hypothetical protein